MLCKWSANDLLCKWCSCKGKPTPRSNAFVSPMSMRTWNVQYCNVQYSNIAMSNTAMFNIAMFNFQYSMENISRPALHHSIAHSHLNNVCSVNTQIKQNVSKRSHKRFMVKPSTGLKIFWPFIYKFLFIIISIFICHLLVRADISDCSELHLLCVGRIHCTSPSAIRRTRVVCQGKAGDLNLDKSNL